MALYYFDTSALAKRYIDEPGGTWVRRIVDAQRVAVAALVQVELASIITRRTREGTILAPDATRILRQFGTDYTRFVSVQLTDDILSAAADLIRQTPIGLPPRSLDAIHLATAQLVHDDATVRRLRHRGHAPARRRPCARPPHRRPQPASLTRRGIIPDASADPAHSRLLTADR